MASQQEKGAGRRRMPDGPARDRDVPRAPGAAAFRDDPDTRGERPGPDAAGGTVVGTTGGTVVGTVVGTDAAGDIGEADPEAGERRAAERSARRAEAVAAAEGFHPLRVRPYVAEPSASAASPEDDAARTGLLPLPEFPDEPPTAELARVPLLPLTERDTAYEKEAAAAAAVRGRHRRRKRRIVVAAAAVAASALAAGAVAVTGQIVGEEESGTDLAQPDRTTSVPDVQLPTDMATPATHAAPPAASRGHAAPARPTAPSASPSSASPGPTPTPTATSTASGAPAPSGAPTASAPASPSPTAPPPSGTPPTSAPPNGPLTPAPSDVLRLGDSGPQVADLQRRLTRVWTYHGPVDGRYGEWTRQAVATFQVWYGITADPSGVYGPATRAALENATGGPDHH